MATDPNDAWMDNPVFAGRGPTQVLTYTATPAQPKKRSVPPAVGRIIGELGLRYRPSAQADLEAHGHAIRLLCEDVADVPPHLLEQAAREWVRCKPFMPKASELVGLAQNLQRGAIEGSDYALKRLQDHCDRLNALNGGRDGWHVVGKAPNRTIAKAREHRADAA